MISCYKTIQDKPTALAIHYSNINEYTQTQLRINTNTLCFKTKATPMKKDIALQV